MLEEKGKNLFFIFLLYENATMDEVESKLSSLSISANQQLEGKQQEAETGDTKPCTEKRDCAKSNLPLEEGREVYLYVKKLYHVHFYYLNIQYESKKGNTGVFTNPQTSGKSFSVATTSFRQVYTTLFQLN